jgi:hypothetical protein
LAIVMAYNQRWTAENLEDAILQKENGGTWSQDELPGSRSHAPIKIGGNAIFIIVGRHLDSAKTTHCRIFLGSRKGKEGKATLFSWGKHDCFAFGILL